MVKLCGIDEAGKGPVIGPMVLCAACTDEKKIGELKALGVKDSKLLSIGRRKDLYMKLKTMLEYKIDIISVEDIDLALESPESNIIKLEAQRSGELLRSLKPDKAIIDCPSANIRSYTSLIQKVAGEKIKLLCEHKADHTYAIVSAASIIAKYIRDAEIENLKRKYNIDFGSGYPSDPFTRRFLEKNYSKYPFFRKTWASWKNIAKKNGQRKLGQF